MMKPTRQARTIKSTRSKAPFNKLQIDLVDMSSSTTPRGNNWLFTAIDAYTRKAYALPMPNKNENTVLDSLDLLLDELPRLPKSIQSDNGSEFINRKFKARLKSLKIKQILSTAGKPQTNGLIERFNGTLKRFIKSDLLSTGENDWDVSLPLYLKAYNSTPQTTTGKAPDKLVEEWKQSNMKRAPEIKQASKQDLATQQFKIGDQVRIKLVQNPNQKRAENWSKDLYQVAEVFKPRQPWSAFQYQVKDSQGGLLKTKYGNEDLQQINAVENKSKLAERFELSSISRPSVRDGKQGYIVRYKGYSKPEWNSLENLELDVPKMLRLFDKRHNVVWKKDSRDKWTFSWKKK